MTNNNDDKSFEAFLEGEDELSRQYKKLRNSVDTSIPDAMEQTILLAAKQAVQQPANANQKRTWWQVAKALWPHHWAMPTSMAAVLITLSVVITQPDFRTPSIDPVLDTGHLNKELVPESLPLRNQIPSGRKDVKSESVDYDSNDVELSITNDVAPLEVLEPESRKESSQKSTATLRDYGATSTAPAKQRPSTQKLRPIAKEAKQKLAEEELELMPQPLPMLLQEGGSTPITLPDEVTRGSISKLKKKSTQSLKNEGSRSKPTSDEAPVIEQYSTKGMAKDLSSRESDTNRGTVTLEKRLRNILRLIEEGKLKEARKAYNKFIEENPEYSSGQLESIKAKLFVE